MVYIHSHVMPALIRVQQSSSSATTMAMHFLWPSNAGPRDLRSQGHTAQPPGHQFGAFSLFDGAFSLFDEVACRVASLLVAVMSRSQTDPDHRDRGIAGPRKKTISVRMSDSDLVAL